MPVRVSKVDQPPNRCGFTLRADDPEGYFLGEVLSGWDQKAAVSVSYARNLARELGYVHPDEHAETQKMLGQYAGECDLLRAHVARLEAEADAIDGLVRNRDYVVRKRVGRPPEKEKVL